MPHFISVYPREKLPFASNLPAHFEAEMFSAARAYKPTQRLHCWFQIWPTSCIFSDTGMVYGIV